MKRKNQLDTKSWLQFWIKNITTMTDDNNYPVNSLTGISKPSCTEKIYFPNT